MFQHILMHITKNVGEAIVKNRKAITVILQKTTQTAIKTGNLQETYQASKKACQEAFQAAQLAELQKYKYLCPSCGKPPPLGTLLKCYACNKTFSACSSDYMCPNCGQQSCSMMCLCCKGWFSIDQWSVQAAAKIATYVRERDNSR